MKQILITCDTEVGELHADRADAFEIFIKGEVEDREVGVRLINDLASKYGAAVEHFADVYPCERYGEHKFEQLCRDIIRDGHGINLHTHPSGKYDKNRKFMWQYSVDEQTEIVNFGKQKIKEWTGMDVLAHRAGGYGANDDTIQALKLNDIFIDSSFFYKNENCKINYDYINKASEKNGVLQLPVSVYERQKRYGPLKTKSSFQKFDFRYGSSADEILKAIDAMPENCIIVLFLHSFNFLNLKYNFKDKKYINISINDKLINEYKRLLADIANKAECKFASIKDLDMRGLSDEDFAPTIRADADIKKYAEDKFRLKFMHVGDI
ncbi:hypothetical protein [uncultured Campylobacter sp.]|uniref:hypothetical protein n=1 Tax=uncultured Campylobacter sp. TaxID=218934 RepID=UPI0026185C81|nr:hypothetical protein [uncultured Campylobacter sp.]